MEPRVSIGIPVYNAERYLSVALDSIVSQTFRDMEIIICDNASTDGTEKICRDYEAKDSRIRYVRNDENIGAAGNFNKVVELASGEYFKWASYDDICTPAFIEECVSVLDENPSVVLCYPRTTLIDEGGRETGELEDSLNLRSPNARERYRQHLDHFKYEAYCVFIFGLIRMDAFRKTHLLGSYPASDMILLGELALLGEFYEVPRQLFLRRIHPGTSVKANPTFEQRAAWFDPAYAGKPQFTRWRWFGEYLGAITRAPLNLYDKAWCYLFTEMWLLRNWKGALEDLRLIKKNS